MDWFPEKIYIERAFRADVDPCYTTYSYRLFFVNPFSIFDYVIFYYIYFRSRVYQEYRCLVKFQGIKVYRTLAISSSVVIKY